MEVYCKGDVLNTSGQKLKNDEVSLLEDHYRVLVNHTSDLIFLRDSDGILLYLTPSVEKILGYMPEELIGKPTWGLVHPDDRPLIEDWKERVLKQKEGFRTLARLKSKAGDYVWLDTVTKIIRNPKGDFKYLISTSRDVTEKQKAEEINRRHRMFTEMTNDIIVQRDPAGKIHYVSPAVKKHLGYSPEEFSNLPFWGYLDEEGKKRTEEWKSEVFGKGRSIRLQARAKTKAGKFIWMESETQPIKDEAGKVIFSLSSIRNIDAEKQAEFEIAKLAAIVENSVNEIYVTDTKTLRFIYANDQARKNLGYSQEELSQMTPADIGGHLSKNEFKRVYNNMLKSGGVSERVEGKAIRKDGTSYDVSLMGQLINLGDAQVFVTFMEDISEKKQSEALLHQAQKMEVVGQLTGGIAHNFNNLLTTILASLRLLEQGEEKPERKEMLDLAIKSTKRGAELTHRLLAFARKQHLAPTTVHLKDIIEEVQALLVFSIGGNIEVKTRPLKKDLLVKIDPGEFEGALLNLAINSRDAMPKGGTLTISASEVKIDKQKAIVLELDPGSYVVTEMADTGVGMSEEVLGKVFEPFFTTKDIGEGSGLGLSMVFGFAKQSGGAMDIESEPKKGTSVKIYLPKEK